MKGKNTFTAKEISALKQLIRMRVNADKDDQKKIRRIMRSIGFYGSDYGIVDCQVSDLEGLIRSGVIKVIGGKSVSAKLPAKFGKVREDGIIYIGQASTSLRQRFWKQELNHIGVATFFRSIGAMLRYMPPKGSLVGKKNQNNFKFSPEDTESIREWMRKSLIVNCIPFSTETMDAVEKKLIDTYRPLVNNKHNPDYSRELEAAKEKCREYARSK